MKLTVFYNGQYWIGVAELLEDGRLKAARHIFGGSEPSDPEVYAFVMRELFPLMDRVRGAAANTAPITIRAVNPKRLARAAAREVAQHGASNRAQEALRLELEQRKQERKQESRAEREAEAERKRLLRRARARERHRGH